MKRDFGFDQLVELCQRTHEETRRSAARAIDRSLVARNWLFGSYIVNYQQQGSDRAEYGAQTLRTLSTTLRTKIGRGFSVDALERMRRFYLLYDNALSEISADEKSATPSRISQESTRDIPQTQSVESSAPSLIRAAPANSAIVQTLSAQLTERFTLGWPHYVTLLSQELAEQLESVRRELEASESSSDE